MINLIGNIKDTFTILSIVSVMLLGWLKYNDTKEINRLNNNITSVKKEWKTKTGELVTQVTELRFTNKELKQIAERDSSELSDLQKQLWEAGQVIKTLDIKERNAESVNIADLIVSNDSLVTTIQYNEDMSLKALKPIKTDNLSINFKVSGDSIIIDHVYNAKINTVVSREVDKVTSSGKRRFFLARWLNPRWKYYASNYSDDPNAKLDSAIYIKFQHNKGKRNG